MDEAWRTLLLSQHHDCWIVPYNENNLKKGGTWADDVVKWTGNTNARCDSILDRSMSVLEGASPSVRVFNTTAVDRDECVVFTLPAGWKSAIVLDEHHRVMASQATSDKTQWLFQARVPSLGYATYFLKEGRAPVSTGAHAIIQKDGTCRIETDLYSLLLDPSRGGAIRSLEAKRLNDKQFVDPSGRFAFNELRGNFYGKGGFHSSTETPAQVRILENGPLRVRVEVRGLIAGYSFTQVLTLAQGQRRIDAHLKIDWTTNTGIGESPDSVKGYPLKKAFYNDSFKLQALFPLKLDHQKIYKNAPFDVLESRLPNTFFDSWDSIKNVVLLNWVDVTDGVDNYGMAVLSDHTTSYAHGPHYPLGLTIQYSGDGLFYRNYTIQGPSELNYALIPHVGRWDRAGIWTEGTKWNEPLRAWVSEGAPPVPASPVSPRSVSASPVSPRSVTFRSLLHMNMPGWEVSSMIFSGRNLSVRLFNAEGDGSARRIYVGFTAGSARLVALNGRVIQSLALMKDPFGKSYVMLSMPRFGIRTIQFIHVSMSSTTH
jgi:alpha-mannosidase